MENNTKSAMHSDKMREKSVGKLLFEMSIPAILSMLVHALYNIVDSVFVSNVTKTYAPYFGVLEKLGDDSFQAVSIAFPMTMLVVAVALGVGVGANAYVARKLGEGQTEKANQAAKTAIIMGVIAWLIMLVLAFTVVKPFVSAFVNAENSSDTAYVAEQGSLYLCIYMAASLGGIIEIVCERLLQSTGNMKMPMISQLTGAIINIVLDALFILVFNWGVLGAILATVIGQWAAAGLAMFFLLFKKQDISISLKGYKPKKEYFLHILKTGTPAFVMNAMGSFITIILNTLLKEGTGIFVLSAYFKMQSFIFMPVFGLMQGLMPILSYNYGANLKQRFNRALKLGYIISLCIMAFGTVLFLTLPNFIMSVFTSDAQIISDGAYAFRIICICFIPAAISIVTINMLQAINRPFSSLLMSLCRQIIILIPSAFILFFLFGQGGIWFCYPIAEVLAVCAFIPVAIIAYKKQFAYKQEQYEKGLIKAENN
ncbi:MAG: MATE family efflux transporter [Clostridia bacterium]|nr:MATE family efflux transporter [Clostridia bacterium]